LAKQKGLRFSVDIAPDMPSINGSPSRLQQVIVNLVTNAINYTPEGEVAIRARQKDSEVLVEVTDTGCGVPQEELPKVFEDFFRGSNTEARGTGLGLSISKRIIEAHGGRIWALSPCPETGKGCKFSFTLPIKPQGDK
jgi:signal transduction histidine kinase